MVHILWPAYDGATELGLAVIACAIIVGNSFPPVKRLGGVSRPAAVMFFAN
jgi:hypothetical protein